MNFGELLPDLIFQAVLTQGYIPTGTLFPLNSYENRVYEIPVEEGFPLIAKFYRPGRWSLAALTEEHAFLSTLKEAEVPVVAPLELKESVGPKTLALTGTTESTEKIYYAFFPKFRGKEHDEVTNDDRLWMGRTLARLHNVSQYFPIKHRLHLDPETYGYNSLDFILTQPFLPSDLKESIESTLLNALERVDSFFATKLNVIPVHGDCHPGNVLWNQDGPHLLDFDDMLVAPPVQDVWMLFNGDAAEKKKQQEIFFEGYETFRSFDQKTLILSEPLRTLRIIRHASWIGQRYEEPAFQRAFPYFRERRYWEEFLLDVKEQISLLQELEWS